MAPRLALARLPRRGTRTRLAGDAHASIDDPRLTHYWAGTIDLPVDRVRPLEEFLGSIVIPE